MCRSSCRVDQPLRPSAAVSAQEAQQARRRRVEGGLERRRKLGALPGRLARSAPAREGLQREVLDHVRQDDEEGADAIGGREGLADEPEREDGRPEGLGREDHGRAGRIDEAEGDGSHQHGARRGHQARVEEALGEPERGWLRKKNGGVKTCLEWTRLRAVSDATSAIAAGPPPLFGSARRPARATGEASTDLKSGSAPFEQR